MDWFGLEGREVGDPYRSFCPSSETFLQFVDRCHATRAPCFLSVNPYREPRVSLLRVHLRAPARAVLPRARAGGDVRRRPSIRAPEPPGRLGRGVLDHRRLGDERGAARRPTRRVLHRVACPVTAIARRPSTSVSDFIPSCVSPNPKVSRNNFGGVVERGVAELLQSDGVSEKVDDFRDDAR